MGHTHCLAPSRLRTPVDAPVGATSYGRLFPDLPVFSADDAFLYALGGVGGLCDCGDAADEPSSLGSEAAGWPFFGQFVAHDITADRSNIRHHVDPAELRNARSPQLNLECLYGDGPVGHPYLFRRDDPAKLLLGGEGADVLRNEEGTAIIGDPRNDSHVFMSQMHLAFARADNALVDRDHTTSRSRRVDCSDDRLSGEAAGPRRRRGGTLRLDTARKPWHNGDDWLGPAKHRGGHRGSGDLTSRPSSRPTARPSDYQQPSRDFEGALGGSGAPASV